MLRRPQPYSILTIQQNQLQTSRISDLSGIQKNPDASYAYITLHWTLAWPIAYWTEEQTSSSLYYIYAFMFYMSPRRIHVLTQDLTTTRIMLLFSFFKQMGAVGNLSSRVAIPGGVNVESAVPNKELVC